MNKRQLKATFGLFKRANTKHMTDIWVRNTVALAEYIDRDEDPDRFIGWPVILNTMFNGDNRATRAMYKEMQKDPYMLARLRLAAKYDDFGAPNYSDHFDGICTNLLYQFYALHQWEGYTGKCVEDANVIVEFGGGYGAMRKVIHNLGFSGDYTIYDLPEFSLMQQYYLSHYGIQFSPFYVEDYRFPVPPQHVDLMIACWSLSEVPTDVRDAFFWTCKPQTCLIAYQDTYEGVNNIQYFAYLRERHPEYRWTEIGHPTMSGQYYLVGDKTGL